MGEFNYRKFLTENKLTYASKEVVSSNLNEDLNKSDFEVGLTILNEIGYNINEDLLTEIKLKDFMTKVGSSIKNSVKALASDKSPSKNNKKDFTKKLALLKKLSPSEEVYNKFIELLKSGKKATVSDLTKLATSSSKEPIEELAKMSDGIKKIMAWVGLSIYLLAFANNLNYTPEQINVANQTTTTIDVGDNYTPILGDVGDTVAKGLDGEREDLSKEDGKKLQKDLEKKLPGTQADSGDIDDDSKDSKDKDDTSKYNELDKYFFGDLNNKGFKTYFHNGIGDISDENAQGAMKSLADEFIKANPDVKSVDLETVATWTDTQGDDASDDKAKGGGSVKDKRQATSEKLMKFFGKALEDGGIKVKTTTKEPVKKFKKDGTFKSDSDEAISNQIAGVKITNMEKGDKTPDPITPDPEDPTPESDDKPMTPKEVIAFYSEKPDFDSNKYMVIAFQLLPRIIGNGKVINNPEFERFAKHLTIAEKGETLNDKFIARRIDGEEGSLVKKAAKAKGTEKEEILDTIDTLRWIRNTKKSPSNIEKWIKRLDPDIKLGERGAFKYRFEKDVTNQGDPGRTAPRRQAGPDKPGEKVGKNPTNMMESQSIYNEWISLLLEFNIAGYDEEAAKKNLGLLTQLYSGIWPRKDGSYIEYDNEYLEDKYKASVDKFEKTFPTIGKKMKQYSKDQKDKKADPKSTPTTSSPEQGQSGPPPLPDTATKVDTPKDTPKPGKDAKATKIEPGKGDNKSGEKVKATKVDAPKGDYFQKGFAGNIPDIKVKKGGKEKSTSAVDFNAKDKSKTPQSVKALEKMGAKKDLTTALSRINNIGEAEELIMALINYVRIDDNDKVKALKQAKARFTPLADQPKHMKSNPAKLAAAKAQQKQAYKNIIDYEKKRMNKNNQPKYTSTSTSGAKVNYNLKEHITRLIGLILEAEKNQKPDVEKTVRILDKYADLKSHLDRLTNKEMTIEFILGIMQFLDPILQDKANTLKTALSNVARDLEKEPEEFSNKVKILNPTIAETLIRKKIRSLIKEQVRRITESDLEVIDVGNEKLKFELKEDSGHYYVIARGEEDNNVKGIIPGIKNGNNYMDKKIKENLCKDSETFKKWAKSQFSDVVEEDFTIREDYNTIIKTIDGMKEVKKDNFCKIDFTKK